MELRKRRHSTRHNQKTVTVNSTENRVTRSSSSSSSSSSISEPAGHAASEGSERGRIGSSRKRISCTCHDMKASTKMQRQKASYTEEEEFAGLPKVCTGSGWGRGVGCRGVTLERNRSDYMSCVYVFYFYF